MQLVIKLSDETYDKVINPNNWYDPNSAIKDIVKAVENGTILPKGHWINKSRRSGCGMLFVASECTCCGKKTPFNCDEFLYRYCPNCGADMREVEE